MTMPNFISKAFSYQDLRGKGGGHDVHAPLGYDQTKIPRDR